MRSIRRLAKDESEQDDVLLLTESATPRYAPLSGMNWRGGLTLTLKETHRFLKIWPQTILSPLMMTVLFYAVFSMGMEVGPRTIHSVPFLRFLAPGLVMMAMAQAAFMGPSISLILSKLQGNIVDVLMPPLSPMALVLGYALSGAIRGVCVGLVTFGALALLLPLGFPHPVFIAYHAAMGSSMLALLGLITGIWGRDFDHLGAVQNFLITPATFLSGTFFSADALPTGWSALCYANPFFYMIDGFRYGFTGVAEGSLWGGAAILLFVNLVLFNVAYWLFASGTRLKT